MSVEVVSVDDDARVHKGGMHACTRGMCQQYDHCHCLDAYACGMGACVVGVDSKGGVGVLQCKGGVAAGVEGNQCLLLRDASGAVEDRAAQAVWGVTTHTRHT